MKEDSAIERDMTTEDISKWRLEGAAEAQAFFALRERTPARLSIGQVGARYPIRAQLRFWADHAAAKDAVESEIPISFAEEYGLAIFPSLCADREEYIRRPDLGRRLSDETLASIRALNPEPSDVCIYLSDGLSAKAVLANGMDTFFTARAGLFAKGLRVAAPFLVQNGRVATMELISEAIQSKVTCVLIGERPGLGVADSMSAYAAFGATPGMVESRRTVISNIHAKGTPAVEAGAWLADLLFDMIQLKCSGFALREAQNARG